MKIAIIVFCGYTAAMDSRLSTMGTASLRRLAAGMLDAACDAASIPGDHDARHPAYLARRLADGLRMDEVRLNLLDDIAEDKAEKGQGSLLSCAALVLWPPPLDQQQARDTVANLQPWLPLLVPAHLRDALAAKLQELINSGDPS